jgi:hypothetical protein
MAIQAFNWSLSTMYTDEIVLVCLAIQWSSGFMHLLRWARANSTLRQQSAWWSVWPRPLKRRRTCFVLVDASGTREEGSTASIGLTSRWGEEFCLYLICLEQLLPKNSSHTARAPGAGTTSLVTKHNDHCRTPRQVPWAAFVHNFLVCTIRRPSYCRQ